jgi:hypothetical protein
MSPDHAARRALTALPRLAWRWFTGQPLDGVQRSDAGWFTKGTRTLDRTTAPREPERLSDEIRGDIRKFRRERWDLLVRRKLRRELREVERQVLTEHDGPPAS